MSLESYSILCHFGKNKNLVTLLTHKFTSIVISKYIYSSSKGQLLKQSLGVHLHPNISIMNTLSRMIELWMEKILSRSQYLQHSKSIKFKKVYKE